jgi:hypothetical protein
LLKNDSFKVPPHGGSAWFDPSAPDVGTGDIGSQYLWDVRIRLQLRLADGVIVDARCHTADDDSAYGPGGSPDLEALISKAIAGHVIGKTPRAALDLSGPPRPADGRLPDPPHPAQVMWHAGFAEDAIRDALADWAAKDPSRASLVPAPPPPPRKRGFLRRLLGL